MVAECEFIQSGKISRFQPNDLERADGPGRYAPKL
jgi:hypothetical protein